jgi:protein gp37
MSDGSKIEWTDATVNAINGCSLASPGCTNCYAMRLAGTRMKNHPSRKGLTIDTKAGPVWNGEVRLVETALLQPLRWQRSRIIFWNAHGDPFHPNVPDAWVNRQFAVMALTPQHKHLVLTKRADRMREYMLAPSRKGTIAAETMWLSDALAASARSHTARIKLDHFSDCFAGHGPFKNIWLGVSVEDQTRAEERIPDLIETPAAGRFLSCEPLLGPLDLSEWLICPNALDGLPMDPSTGAHECCSRCDWTGLLGAIDGIIVGGESGPGARPMHPGWARSLRNQCSAAGVDFHFKQWGNVAPLLSALSVPGEGVGIVAWPDGTIGAGHADRNGGAGQQMYRAEKKIAGRHLDGVTHDALPWTREQ